MINNDKIFFGALSLLLGNIACLIFGVYGVHIGNIVHYSLFVILAVLALFKVFSASKSKYIKWLYSENLFKIS